MSDIVHTQWLLVFLKNSIILAWNHSCREQVITCDVYVIHSKVINQKLITPGNCFLTYILTYCPRVWHVGKNVMPLNILTSFISTQSLCCSGMCSMPIKWVITIEQRSRNFRQVVDMFINNLLFFWRSHSLAPEDWQIFMEEKQIGFVMKSCDRI